MKKQLVAGGALAAIMLTLAAKEPVVMTVNGVDVPLSEFEYLYHKNSRQQVEPQPLDEYVEMFKLYKLKVADALNDRLDTLPSYVKEMEQYRSELAEPYLADSLYINQMIDEGMTRAPYEVEARHIMLFKKQGQIAAQRATLDSIRQAVTAGADWNQLAAKYSQDAASASNGGLMGFIAPGTGLPYEFEEAVFSTPEGKISDIVEGGATLHLIKGGKRRPTSGRVLAAHILKLVPPGTSPENEARIKATVDSIYAIVSADPARFGIEAKNNSDDKGSARNDGRLPWFTAGKMVPEFSDAAFALADGEISKPVRSKFGWHIIKKLESNPEALTRDDEKMTILMAIRNPQDPRMGKYMRHQTDKLMKKHKARIDEAGLADVKAYMATNGLDSVFYDRFSSSPEGDVAVMWIGKTPVPRKEMLKGMHRRPIPKADVAVSQFASYFDWFVNSQLRRAEMDWLEANEPDYRNLLQEYREGSLLYEASNRKVWDKASRDSKGLEKYFEQHRADYRWDRPHAKGYLVQALNDSVAGVVREMMDKTPVDSLVAKVRKLYGGVATIDHISVAKGDNAMVDYLIFDGPKAQPRMMNLKAMFMYAPRIIEQPEEAGDVRGQVTTDYQNALMEEWVAGLQRKYPVVINRKTLKKVK